MPRVMPFTAGPIAAYPKRRSRVGLIRNQAMEPAVAAPPSVASICSIQGAPGGFSAAQLRWATATLGNSDAPVKVGEVAD